MKPTILILYSIFFSFSVFAQTEDKSDKKERRIETIKIIDGDTVMHDIRISDGKSDHQMSRHKHRIIHDSREIEIELDSIVESLDMYLNLDDEHKKMIVRRVGRSSEELDEILKDLEENEDIIIDLDRQNGKTKVIRIEIDEKDGKEVEIIEEDGSVKHAREKARNRERRDNKGRDTDDTGGLHVFPNPSSGNLNIKFRLDNDDKAELTVKDSTGKTVFKKDYNEKGDISEVIQLKEDKKGIFIIHLNQKRRSEISKIIVE